MKGHDKKSPVLKLYIDEDGKVLKATNMLEVDLTDEDYDPKETKRIVGDGRLASQNWCCWKLVVGVWRCGPC